jgi:hypothetical protein
MRRRGFALAAYPNLAAHVARGEARPAFKRAFAARLAVFAGGAPTGRCKVRSGSGTPQVREEGPKEMGIEVA